MPRSGEKTKARILDVAYAQFRRRGYTRVSMDEIAAAASVTKRTLYYHFESKDQLLAAVLETQHHLALAAFRTFRRPARRFAGADRRDVIPRPCSVVGQAALGRLRVHPPRHRAGRSSGTSGPRHRPPSQGAAWKSTSPNCWPGRISRSRARPRARSGSCPRARFRLILVHRDRSYAAAAAEAAKKLLRLASPKKRAARTK